MPFASVNGASLFFTDDGQGPTIVLVHGWGCDSNDWIWQIPPLRRRHRVIAVDLRGHGRSEVTRSGYSIESFAEDVAGLLLLRGASPAVLIGHSLGGTVVNRLAVQRPELTSAVVAIDPAYAVQEHEAVTTLEAAARTAASDADPSAVEAAHQAIAELFPMLSTSMTPPHLKEWHRRRALGTAPLALGATAIGDGDLRRWRGGGVEPMLQRRAVPVLAIHRREVAASWERSLLRGARDQVHHLPGGHWPHQEQPEVVNAILLAWLDSLVGAG